MDPAYFNDIVGKQIAICQETLGLKAEEYATGTDRLHNFRVAAALEGESLRKSLTGMMAKHTVSIYDMCSTDDAYSLPAWEEKIKDHINYLLLLRAVIQEEFDEMRELESATINVHPHDYKNQINVSKKDILNA